MIILMAGLPASGKTTLARELARRSSGRVLSKDEFRHAIFLPEEIEYSSLQDDFALELMLSTAGYLLQRDSSRMIFLDGRPFSRRYQIENVLRVARQIEQPWRILECVCSESSARERLQANAGHPAGNRDFQLYLEVKARFEAIVHPKTTIDTEQAFESCVERGMAALKN